MDMSTGRNAPLLSIKRPLLSLKQRVTRTCETQTFSMVGQLLGVSENNALT